MRLLQGLYGIKIIFFTFQLYWKKLKTLKNSCQGNDTNISTKARIASRRGMPLPFSHINYRALSCLSLLFIIMTLCGAKRNSQISPPCIFSGGNAYFYSLAHPVWAFVISGWPTHPGDLSVDRLSLSVYIATHYTSLPLCQILFEFFFIFEHKFCLIHIFY